jgi:hypothetical protein
MKRKELLHYARAGAQARLEALQKELDALRRAFPTLGGAPPKLGHRRSGEAVAAPIRKRKMSAAGRKRIGEAARKRWAAWRKAQGKN